MGLGCAKKFASLGYSVVISGRREDVLRSAAESINNKSSGDAVRCYYFVMDVRNAAQVTAAIEYTVSCCGSLPNIIVNNAAGNFISPSENLSPNAWKTIMDIVFFGTVHVIGEVGKRWIQLRSGPQSGSSSAEPQVVFVSVGASYVSRGAPFLAPSAAAKAAVLSVHESLAVEWGKYNMRFFMISPGYIHTEGASSRLDPSGRVSEDEIKRVIPLQRAGTVEEYAHFVAFTTSTACSWLTGVNIHLDGGSAAAGGEFQDLKNVPKEQWTALTKQIRHTSSLDKEKRAKL